MIQNQWYVGCASSQLKADLKGVQILDEPVVLFRDEHGKACALLDRCCHRGFPLSKSKIKDGRIQCGFHGWQYDNEGKVTVVPSQNAEKTIPKSFCVKSFRCAENDGYVWVWAGEGEPGPTPKIPDVAKGGWIQGSRVINCHYLRALEITFDAPHVYFLHPSHPATVAAAKHGFIENQMELRVTEHGCIAFAPPSASETDPIPTYGFGMEFSLPGRIRFAINAEMFMDFFTVPIGKDQCRMDWVLKNWAPNAEQGITWTGEGGDVIDEDQFALELIQKSYEREGEQFERSVESDTATLLLRRIVRAAEEGQFGKKDLGAHRRVFTLVGAAGFE